MIKKKYLILGIGFLVVLILVGVAVYFGVPRYRAYEQAVLTPTLPEMYIDLLQPQNGDQVETGSPVLMMAHAYGGLPLAEVSFWVNGVPVEVVPVEGAEETGFAAFYDWTPTTAGTYLLAARALAHDGHSVDSAPALLNVVEGSKTALVSELISPDPDYSGPAGGMEGGSTGPAEAWQGSVGEWLFPQDDENLPAPPGVEGEVQDCQVDLKIADHSDDETGFRVYRSQVNIGTWELVETLAANDAFDILTTTDSSGMHGPLAYKVAAFNSQGEAFSPIISVVVDPEDCPQVESPVQVLQMVDFDANIPVDKLYCYLSFEGGGWRRWPEDGFIMPGEAGSGWPMVAVFEDALGKIPSLTALLMDCWGWSGGELRDLGLVDINGIGSHLSPITFGNEYIGGVLDFILPEALKDILGNASIPAFLPVPVLNYTTNAAICHNKSDYSGNILTDYCAESDGETPWPYDPVYVTWELGGGCMTNDTCLDIFNPPEDQNIQFGYFVYEAGFDWPMRQFTSAHQMVYAIPGSAGGGSSCDNNTNLFQVSTYALLPDAQELYEVNSGWLSVPLPCPSTNGRFITYRLDFLAVKPKGEEPAEGDFQEIYADIVLYSGDLSDMQIIQLGAWGGQAPANCPQPDGVDPGTSAFGGLCPIRLDPLGNDNIVGEFAKIDLYDAYLCQGGSGTDCTPFTPQNNLVSLTHVQNEPLTVHIFVKDQDLNSADDVICSFSQTFGADELDSSIIVSDQQNCFLHIIVQDTLTFGN